MKFTSLEKFNIAKVIEIDREEDYSNLLPEEVYNFLKKKNNLRTIKDQLIYSKANMYRLYESYRLTKFLRSDFEIIKFLDSLLSEITPPYLVFIDFHFLIEISTVNTETEQKNNFDDTLGNIPKQLKFQNATKASSVNNVIKIFNSTDYESLNNEFKNFSSNDLLNKAFIQHSELFDYHSSGMKPCFKR